MFFEEKYMRESAFSVLNYYTTFHVWKNTNKKTNQIMSVVMSQYLWMTLGFTFEDFPQLYSCGSGKDLKEKPYSRSLLKEGEIGNLL